ncbi:MAG: hypothetical protein J0G32_07915 [Alphaproteobacteria bacterium]|nr:hypothetical protein [Alphaproteobacteria bacterium]OJV16291.1 MAG: hypothetical protein BGO27_02950 [Alphaproteobacteria bacterium 33-17]
MPDTKPENIKKPNFFKDYIEPVKKFLANPISLAIVGFAFSVVMLAITAATAATGVTLLVPILSLAVTVIGSATSLAYNYKINQKERQIAKVMKAPVRTRERNEKALEILEGISDKLIKRENANKSQISKEEYDSQKVKKTEFLAEKILFTTKDLEQYRENGLRYKKGISNKFYRIMTKQAIYENELKDTKEKGKNGEEIIIPGIARHHKAGYLGKKFIKHYGIANAAEIGMLFFSSPLGIAKWAFFTAGVGWASSAATIYNNHENKRKAVEKIYKSFAEFIPKIKAMDDDPVAKDEFLKILGDMFEDQYIISGMNKKITEKFDKYVTGADGKVDPKKVDEFLKDIDKHKQSVAKTYSKSSMKDNLRSIQNYFKRNYFEYTGYYKQIDDYAAKFKEQQESKGKFAKKYAADKTNHKRRHSIAAPTATPRILDDKKTGISGGIHH